MYKKLIQFVVFSFTCLAFTLNAQSFTGIITYDFKVTGPMADQVKGMIQEKQIVKIKGNNMRQSMKGGIMAQMMGDILILGDKKEAYILQANEKKALKINTDEKKEDAPLPKVTKLNETAEIAGYKCQKYQIEIENAQLGGTLTEYVWATKDIPAIKSNFKGSDKLSIEGVDGMVLKMVTDMNGMFTLTMVASQVQKQDLSDSEFTLPKDYTVEKFDPSMFNGMGGK